MSAEKTRFIISLEMIIHTEGMGTLEVLDRVIDEILAITKMEPDFKRLYIKELEGGE